MMIALGLFIAILGVPFFVTLAFGFMNWAYDRFQEPWRLFFICLGSTSLVVGTVGTLLLAAVVSGLVP